MARKLVFIDKTRPGGRRRKTVAIWLVGLLIGVAGGLAWFGSGETRANLRPPPAQFGEFLNPDEVQPSARFYRNCAAARAEGVFSIRRGQPGYREPLDADGDGLACEPPPPTPRLLGRFGPATAAQPAGR
jgi:hypothetical protein